MRLMALDVGKKRIGIAVSDPLWITAQGLDTYLRKSLDEDIEHYRQLIKTHEVGKLIIGLPKRLNGELGQAAEEIMTYANAIQDALGIDVVMFDERMTSAAANRILIDSDVKRKKRKQAVDRMAAMIILQDYMESHKHEG